MAFLRADRDDSLEGHLLWGKVTQLDLPLGLAPQLPDLCLAQGNVLSP